jgi:hypothetical protein
MKKIQLLLLSLVFTNLTFPQNNQKEKNLNNDRVAVVSINKDTLWLVDNSLGRLIANTWDYTKYTDKKPRIIMVDILPDQRYIEAERKKNKKKFKG